MNSLYRIMEWIMRVSYINILWIFLTLAGFIIGGIFPATVGMFAVIRQWLIKDSDTVPIWKTFFKAFKNDFLKANILGYVSLLIGWIIYIDFKFFQGQSGYLFSFLSYLFLIILIIYLAMWTILFPTFVHYDLKVLQYLKQAFLITVLRPLNVIIAVFVLLVLSYLLFYVPFLIPFFGVSIPAFLTMWITLQGFKKLQLKIETSKEQ